jgi:hypothetical protein
MSARESLFSALRRIAQSRKVPECDCGFFCPAKRHVHGCWCDYGKCDTPSEHHAVRES